MDLNLEIVTLHLTPCTLHHSEYAMLINDEWYVDLHHSRHRAHQDADETAQCEIGQYVQLENEAKTLD